MKFFKSLNQKLGLSLCNNQQDELNKINAKIQSSSVSSLAYLENNANFFNSAVLHLCLLFTGTEAYSELRKRRQNMDKIYTFRQMSDTALIEAINSDIEVKQYEWLSAYAVAEVAASYERKFFEEKLKSIHYKTFALTIILMFSTHALSHSRSNKLDIPICGVMALLAITEMFLMLAKNDVIPLFHSNALEKVVSQAEENGIQFNIP